MTDSPNPLEMLAVCLSHCISDNEAVYVGTGLPLVGGLLAKATHAPNSTLVFESGAQDPVFRQKMPWSVSCPWTYYKSPLILDMAASFGQCAAGYVDVGFLGGAQVDRFGNINTTVIGSMENVQTRLTGSGGANDLGSLCNRIVIVGLQMPNKFPEKVDFITTPGHLAGGDSRARAGLRGEGPWRVVTQLGVYGFAPYSRSMTAITLHPGVTREMVRQSTGFEIMIPDNVGVTPLPTAEEIQILRTQVDPNRVFTAFPPG